jgi:ABC-type iron transport system FetAB ATPase subunit
VSARLSAAGLRSVHAGPFDVTLNSGACLAVMGPSGAGKSLFLRMIADLDPHEGEAWLDGAPRSGMSAPAWRRQVGYVAAEAGWWLDRVGEHFTTAPTRLLGEMGLPAEILDRPVALCSTGERQRLALARTLCGDPAVLLLDEPTAALDAASIAAVESVLQTRLRLGAAMVMVTHDPAQAARLGTEHVRIEKGRMLTGPMVPL